MTEEIAPNEETNGSADTVVPLVNDGPAVEDNHVQATPIKESNALADRVSQINQTGRKQFGQMLVDENVISQEQLEEALAIQRETGQKLGDVLIKKELTTDKEISKTVARQMDLPFYEKLPLNDVDVTLVKDLPINFCKSHLLVPIARDDFSCTVAVADPLNVFPVDDLRLLIGSNINLIVAPQGVIIETINRVYERNSDATQSVLDDLEEDITDFDDLEDTKDLLDADDDEAPIIRLVHSMLFKAVKERATDIHIDPYERDLKIRFRIDGALYDMLSPPKRFQSAISSRVKIMGKLNIAEKRLPQDGRIKVRAAGKDIDIRISILPTIHGERIVMRLLDNSGGLLGLNQIGIPNNMLATIEKLISKKHGIVLCTGPTGSGKTTTLYSMLSEINTPEKNIMTIEDPVEIQLSGIAQINVKEAIGLTFAEGLRSILRQDPNVVLIGEIRDPETATIAVQASMTGHLVFSTLHTNDTASTVARLIDLGIESYQITSSLLAVIAVRLTRTLCKHCKEPTRVSQADIDNYGLDPKNLNAPIFKAKGCDKCKNMGYMGQTGIYELMEVDDTIKTKILQSPDATALRHYCAEIGILTIREQGFLRVLDGSTSFEEILLKTQVDN